MSNECKLCGENIGVDDMDKFVWCENCRKRVELENSEKYQENLVYENGQLVHG